MDCRLIIAGCRDFNEYALLRERHERQTYGQTHWCFFGNGGTLKEGVRHIDNKGEKYKSLIRQLNKICKFN